MIFLLYPIELVLFEDDDAYNINTLKKTRRQQLHKKHLLLWKCWVLDMFQNNHLKKMSVCIVHYCVIERRV